MAPLDHQSVEVVIKVIEVNTTQSSLSTFEDQIQRVFIPFDVFFQTNDYFYLVANAGNSEVCSRLLVQGTSLTYTTTYGPHVRLMLESKDFPYGVLVTISNIPKNESVCYTSEVQGSDEIKFTSINIEEIGLRISDIIWSCAFSLIVFLFFFGITYLPRLTKTSSSPNEQSEDQCQENQMPLQERVLSKRQSKKKQHKRLYKTLGTLLLIAIIGSIIANSVYFFHLLKLNGDDQDKCYFNEKCLMPKNLNKVLSNLQFILYGIALILAPIFSLKVCKLEQVSSGMGILLILQGLNSMTYHLCPGQDSLFIDRVPMHFLFSFCLYVVLNHMIPKHAKTKILLCCVVPTISVIMEVLGSFQVIPKGIGSWFLKILVLGFLVTLIVDLVLYYRKWKGNYCLERLPFLILAILVLVPGSIAVFFFQAKSSDTKVTSVMSREHNQDCLVGIYDQHDLWHVFSSSAIYLGYFTLYKRYSYV